MSIELQVDSLLILLQRSGDYRERVDATVNGDSYRWVSMSLSLDALIRQAKGIATSYEDVQIGDLEIVSLSNGSLDPIELQELETPPERLYRCDKCNRSKTRQYFGTGVKTDRRRLTCRRCLDERGSKIPYASTSPGLAR